MGFSTSQRVGVSLAQLVRSSSSSCLCLLFAFRMIGERPAGEPQGPLAAAPPVPAGPVFYFGVWEKDDDRKAADPTMICVNEAFASGVSPKIAAMLDAERKRIALQEDAAAAAAPLRLILSEDIKTADSSVRISNPEMKLIVEWIEHHRGQNPPVPQKPLRSKVMREVCADPWDADFIDRIADDRSILYQLIHAAYALELNSLMYLGAAKVAALCKGEPLDRIKQILAPQPDNPPQPQPPQQPPQQE